MTDKKWHQAKGTHRQYGMKTQMRKNELTCPYCHKKHGRDEGSSEMSMTGREKINCPYCAKNYYIERD